MFRPSTPAAMGREALNYRSSRQLESRNRTSAVACPPPSSTRRSPALPRRSVREQGVITPNCTADPFSVTGEFFVLGEYLHLFVIARFP